MKTTFLTFLFLLCTWSVQAQGSAEQIGQAESFYEAGEYQKSGEAYSAAFSTSDGSVLDYYNAACSWALAGKSDQAMHYLKKAMEKGWTNVNHLKSDSDLSLLHEHSEWSSVVASAQKNLDDYEATLNKPIKEQLEKIYVKDQTLRQLYREAEEKFGRESDEMKYFWEVIDAQDRENEAEVEKIIDEHGWVGKSEVGGKANMTLWLVIQHAPIETQEKYLPMLKESAMKGESRGSHLALLEDRILMGKGKPQIYGSQIHRNPDTGNQEVYQVEDPENINARRAAVGLGPIEDYVKRFGLTWTTE